jgi:hypothetical protein
MQTITSKNGVVAQCGTRADMTCAVPTLYTRAYMASGQVRVIFECDGEQTVMFAGEYGPIRGFVQPIEVRVREHGMIPAEKVPLDDVQQAAKAEAERLADGRG